MGSCNKEIGRTQDLLELHDGAIRSHPLVHSVVFTRVPGIKVLGILVVLGIVSHVEALRGARSP